MTYQIQASKVSVVPTFCLIPFYSPSPLQFARKKLFDSAVPLQIRAVAYIRIGCSEMCRHTLPAKDTASAKDSKISYRHLLTALSNHQADWWNLCSIHHDGYLISNDQKIGELLDPLNTFVAQEPILDSVADL